MDKKKKRKINGIRIADELIEVAQKEIIEDDIEYPDEFFDDIEELGYTCDTCDLSNQCPYAYDPYCVLGDCLMEK